MKTILVLTDFSEHALYALKVAASIAKKMNAKIKLVHTYDLSSSTFPENFYYQEYYDQIRNQAEERLNALIILDIIKDTEISKLVITDMHIRRLVTHNKYKDVDLIVIGSHGTSGQSEEFIGSNTEKVVRLANAPVLTIKNEHDDFDIKNIVFASNFYDESYAIFEKIKSFAGLYKAQIHLLKVITPKNFEPTPVSKKLMEKFAGKFSLTDSTITIYNATSIKKGITDFSDEINADLIAIETHGRTGIAHLINGSLAEDVANHIDRPVLSIKMGDKPKDTSSLSSYPKEFRNWGVE